MAEVHVMLQNNVKLNEMITMYVSEFVQKNVINAQLLLQQLMTILSVAF